MTLFNTTLTTTIIGNAYWAFPDPRGGVSLSDCAC
jgi:hypothetical protein